MTHTEQNEIIERIRFLISNFRLSQAQFAKKLGIDPANLSKHLNGKLPITRGLINRIAVDLSVSKEWLSTGTGVPFPRKTGLQRRDSDRPGAPDTLAGRDLIPVYDIDVTAGSRELSREFTDERIIGAVSMPNLKPECAIVRVFGDSMSPTIQDGGYIAIRKIDDLSCIFWGQIYVIVLDDYRMVKKVRRHPDKTMITLHSDNPDYDDIEIERSKIRGLFLVETILNLKMQC